MVSNREPEPLPEDHLVVEVFPATYGPGVRLQLSLDPSGFGFPAERGRPQGLLLDVVLTRASLQALRDRLEETLREHPSWFSA